jgi:hypothetical protein
MMQAIRGREAHDTDAECDVYNAVFEELGLNWHWTRATLRSLAAIPVEEARIAEYLRTHQPHLLSAYPVEFLAGAIAEAKARRVCRI